MVPRHLVTAAVVVIKTQIGSHSTYSTRLTVIELICFVWSPIFSFMLIGLEAGLKFKESSMHVVKMPTQKWIILFLAKMYKNK